MQKEFPKPGTTELTEREGEILRMIATGTSNKDIAQQLFISSNTVKVHLRNIFAKIGVSSRTEAAVYAIHADYSQAPASRAAEPAIQEGAASAASSLETKRKAYYPWVAALVIVLLLGGIAAYRTLRPPNPGNAIASPMFPSPSPPSRWQEHAPMPTARSGLAVAVHENKIYAIGGETAQGVSGMTEQYDQASDTWTTLAAKPVPVSDVSAAVIGGKIFIPGGRLASGEVSDVLEAYDPSRNQWEKHASLPVALSGVALAAFEGKLYLFGGWDGQKYLASVYEYEPDGDAWRTRTAMPTARGFAGASVAGGRIYVIGGYDGEEALVVNEEYLPSQDTWVQRAPLPAGRYAMGVASLADYIYILGGIGETDSILLPLQFISQQNQWQSFEGPFTRAWTSLGLVPMQTELYAVGGLSNDIPDAQNLSYKAIYTISIPVFNP